MGEETARRVEEVEVRLAGERVRQAVEDVAGGEEVDVEGTTVEGDEEALARGHFLEEGEHSAFFRIVACEELAGDEGIAFEPAQADEEREGAGAAG